MNGEGQLFRREVSSSHRVDTEFDRPSETWICYPRGLYRDHFSTDDNFNIVAIRHSL